MTNQTLGRFSILSYNDLSAPNKCAICGSFAVDGSKEFVDFDCWIEDYGSIYFCVDCFISAAQLLELIPVVKFREALAQILELKDVTASLISENGRLRNELDALRTVNRPDPDSYIIPYPVVQIVEVEAVRSADVTEVSDGDSSGSNQEPSEGQSGDDPDVTTGESGPVEPSNVGRSKNVFDNDSNDPSDSLRIFGI
jgi:hypothetical protein